METKETASRTFVGKTMLEDVEYYKYIFKKTEKMSCAVFYILRSDTSIRQNDTAVLDLEATTRALQDVSLESLSSTEQNRDERANALRYALIRFESKLRVAHAARVLSTELLEVFLHEIDSVQRSLKRYLEPNMLNPLGSVDMSYEPVRERKPVRIEGRVQTGMKTVTHSTPATLSRRERVLNVLKDKGEATIKDIVEVVTDCSEKTIQRELTSLIKDSVIVREGERRWSKYMLV